MKRCDVTVGSLWRWCSSMDLFIITCAASDHVIVFRLNGMGASTCERYMMYWFEETDLLSMISE